MVLIDFIDCKNIRFKAKSAKAVTVHTSIFVAPWHLQRSGSKLIKHIGLFFLSSGFKTAFSCAPLEKHRDFLVKSMY